METVENSDFFVQYTGYVVDPHKQFYLLYPPPVDTMDLTSLRRRRSV